MRTIRMFQIAFAVLVLSIFIGCSDSDNLTSSGSDNLPVTKSKKGVSELEDNIPSPVPVIPTYRERIRIKPFRSYAFDVSNTGFKKITSVDIEQISSSEADANVQSCSDFAIHGDSEQDAFISCHSNGLQYKRIVIENLTSKFVELEVSLTGVKEKKSRLDSD